MEIKRNMYTSKLLVEKHIIIIRLYIDNDDGLSLLGKTKKICNNRMLFTLYLRKYI